MIRTADPHEYGKIIDFYYKLIDDMQGTEYHPKWQKGIYPDPEEIRTALERSEMIVDEDSGSLIAAMRVNSDVTEGYEKIAWGIDAAKDEVAVIHMLGVDVAHQRRGVASEMVRFVIDRAEKEGRKAVRLDVLVGNTPASRLYESLGFQFKETVTLYYEDTGVTDFDLYELVL